MDHEGESDIIDLGEYRRRRPEGRRTAFAVWGGEGERSRFALPVWRAVYLVGGERGALVWVEDGTDPGSGLNPFFVLDLASETPRTTFAPDLLGEVRGSTGGSPILSETLPGGVAVYLGAGEDRRWFLVVDDGGLPRQAMDAAGRNDLLFLAGECAGLLLHRRLDRHPADPFDSPVDDWDSGEDQAWDDEDEGPVGAVPASGQGADHGKPTLNEDPSGGNDPEEGNGGIEEWADDDPEPDLPPGRGRGHLRSL